MNQKTFTFIDLFAGIGGFRKGLKACGGKCVFTCEKDKYAMQTYKANYEFANDNNNSNIKNNHNYWDDITTLDEKIIPNHDILCAGFPCQSFSLAGIPSNKFHKNKSGLFANGKGNLFFDVVRIINAKKPKAFILENVKNLLSHDNGQTFKIIRIFLEQYLKYHIQWRVIDSKYFVPQSRKRIIIGFKEKNDFNFDKLPLPANDNNLILKNILQNNKTVNEKYTLSDKRFTFLKAHKEKHKKAGNGFGYRIANLNKPFGTLCASYGASSSIFISQEELNKNPRKLTPRECSRLMGFDEKNKRKFKIVVSNSKAYKQFGNAVVPQVIEWVGRKIKRFI
jgi:DNA (cytosine-5)-methyltransferase 1